MTWARFIIRLAVGVALVITADPPAQATVQMIRLGYPDCAACHISPQGGGLLNAYGRGIDQAQSLRGGEYRPSERGLFKALSWKGHITQDLRLVMEDRITWTQGQPAGNSFRPRLMYRNVTEVGKGFRFSGTITGEGASAPRPARGYDPATPPADLFINTVLVHYRASNTLEFAAGRDQLPSGVNIPELGIFIKSSNRLGYYDAPAQFKAFYRGKRYHVTPFVYGPSGNESSGERESGGGSLIEFDLLGQQRTMVGVTLQQGTARNGGRRILGAHARLGFGTWGVLAEHDLAYRTRDEGTVMSFRQDATYGHVFWAMREWLVASAISERLRVESPFEQHLTAGTLNLQARLASQATLSFGARIERDMVTRRTSKALVFQVAFKTVE